MEEKIMHLLITEDDMALAQGLQRALQEKNRQVLCCKNIQETRQHLHQNKTDLLILDVICRMEAVLICCRRSAEPRIFR